MKVVRKGSTVTFTYKKDLSVEIVKAKKDLNKIKNDISMYEKIYEKAKKEFFSKKQRMIDLQNFIALAEQEKEKNER